MNLEKIASDLFLADKNATALTRFTARFSDFHLQDGYEVQNILLKKHIQSGALLTGYKMGMTSKAKMQQMGIDAPIHGFLTDKMHICDGGEVSLKNRIHAKAEPEIAFIMGKDLSGSPSVAEALLAVDAVTCAIEVIDSRFKDFDFKLPDVVADNCSSSAYVLGSLLIQPQKLDFSNLGIIFSINGKAVQYGSSAAILGHPGRSLVELVKLFTQAGHVLRAGSVVLAGGATAAVSLQAGDRIKVEVQSLGAAELLVRE